MFLYRVALHLIKLEYGTVAMGILLVLIRVEILPRPQDLYLLLR